MNHMINGEIVEMTDEEVADFVQSVASVRQQLPKSTITARLIEMGKIGVVHTALMANPVAYARWFTPDWPEVYADDEGLLTFLAGVGLTEEEISSVIA